MSLSIAGLYFPMIGKKFNPKENEQTTLYAYILSIRKTMYMNYVLNRNAF
jgi:hypothetical protein